MAEPQPAAEPAAPTLSSAADRIRSTAQWMVVTFGAVAGVLVAGLQLTSLKDTVGDDRTTALIGYGLAVGGTLLAILAAAVTLTAGRRSLHDLEGTGGRLSLRKHLNAMTDLRAGFESVAQLVHRTNEALRAYTQAWETWRKRPDDETRNKLDASIDEVNRLVPLSDRLLDVASFEHLRRTWAVCRLLVVLGAILAGVGVAVFAANAAASDEETQAAIPATPVLGTATLTPRGTNAHRAELGRYCDTAEVKVVVLAADDKEYSLVAVPTALNPCGPASLTLARSQGSVKARESVALTP